MFFSKLLPLMAPIGITQKLAKPDQTTILFIWGSTTWEHLGHAEFEPPILLFSLEISCHQRYRTAALSPPPIENIGLAEHACVWGVWEE